MNKITNFFSKKKHFAFEMQNQSKIVFSSPQSHQINAEILRERRVVALESQTIEADVFKLLRTKVLMQLKERQWNSFGITSPTQGAGKSMVAANLAIAIAMEVNQKVLLIDLDLLYPKIAWYFNLNINKGLKDYLVSDKSLSDILTNSGIERLTILPGNGSLTETSEILSSPKMSELINEIKTKFPNEVLIFDLPPILASDDVLASFDYYQALLLIIEDGGSQADEIKKALQMVEGKPFLGTVLNKADGLPNYQRHY